MEPEDLGALIQAGRKRRLFEPTAAMAVDLGREAIERLLPHRPPFLFVDRVTAFDPAVRAMAGTRRIDPDDPVLRGHFPNDPVYPGVLLLETIGQLGLCLLGLLENSDPSAQRGQSIRLLKVHHAVFLGEVRPGDDLLLLAKVVDSDEFTGICAGQIVRAEMICAFVVLEVYFVAA